MMFCVKRYVGLCVSGVLCREVCWTVCSGVLCGEVCLKKFLIM